jgi:hypothetical protein
MADAAPDNIDLSQIVLPNRQLTTIGRYLSSSPSLQEIKDAGRFTVPSASLGIDSRASAIPSESLRDVGSDGVG